MTRPPDDDTLRQQALSHWHYFCSCLLPGTVRRIAAWRRLPRANHADLQAELQQELAADCLEHAEQIVGQPPAVRHGRWMRLAERFIYRHCIATPRPPAPPGTGQEPAGPCEAPELPFADDLVTLRNGRRNLRRTAAGRGVNERSLRCHLDRLAERLGADGEHRAFWRQRLAEALTGLAADLLRDRGQVHLLARARRRPDPAGRLRRLRRMAVHFHIRPATLQERSILRRWLRPGAVAGDGAPRQLLESAAALDPGAGAVWLWLFEACLVERDLRAAARALRLGRHFAAAPGAACTLARARLLQTRGRPDAARALVRRGARRWPRERSLRTVAAQFGGAAAEPRAPDAVSSRGP